MIVNPKEMKEALMYKIPPAAVLDTLNLVLLVTHKKIEIWQPIKHIFKYPHIISLLKSTQLSEEQYFQI